MRGRAPVGRRHVDEDEPAGPLRVGGREHECQTGPVERAEQDGVVRSRRVHHGADVVHPRVEREPADRRVGETGAALVEEEHPRERGQLLEQRVELGALPRREHVVEPAAHEDDVARAVADDLVGDAERAAPRVADIGLAHAHMLAPARREAKRGRC